MPSSYRPARRASLMTCADAQDVYGIGKGKKHAFIGDQHDLRRWAGHAWEKEATRLLDDQRRRGRASVGNWSEASSQPVPSKIEKATEHASTRARVGASVSGPGTGCADMLLPATAAKTGSGRVSCGNRKKGKHRETD
eukprot:71254-Chlamydomonas_euryale.AAC.2